MPEFLCASVDPGAVSGAVYLCCQRDLSVWNLRDTDAYSNQHSDSYSDPNGHVNPHADADTGGKRLLPNFTILLWSGHGRHVPAGCPRVQCELLGADRAVHSFHADTNEHRDADEYADAYADTDRDVDINRNPHEHADSDTHQHPYSYKHPDADPHANADANARSERLLPMQLLRTSHVRHPSARWRV